MSSTCYPWRSKGRRHSFLRHHYFGRGVHVVRVSCALKNQPQQQPRKRRRQNCPPVLNSEDSDDNNSGDDDNKESDDHDASFYADLREAKNEKLGAPIPDNYFAALAAIDSENEFLNAMKNAKAEFAEAKAETGSVDGAVERIMDGIRKEEELEAAWDAAAGREEEEKKRENNSGSDDEDAKMILTMLFNT